MSGGVLLVGFDADDFRQCLTIEDARTYPNEAPAILFSDEKNSARVGEDGLHETWTLSSKDPATDSKICAES